VGDLFRRIVRVLEGLFGSAGRRWSAQSQLVHAAALPLLEGTVVRDGVRGYGEPRPDMTRPDEPFLLSVDDAGQFLIVPGARVSLGHLRSGEADLLFLAGVGAVHAHLERTESLSGGPSWSLHPVASERSFVNGQGIAGPTRLVSGDHVRLGENLSFSVQRPDPASHTIFLELLHGLECSGAKRIVLFGEGEGGRLRIGAAAQRHVRVANLEHEILLVHQAGRLFVHCEAGVEGLDGSGEEGVSLPCPPPQRFDLSIGKPKGSHPPFGLAFEPSELAAFRGRAGGRRG